ncbi:MAG: Ku protein [Caulobacteraceae bacterium]|nr:Ku protein [Caulobacter sp.]
MAVRPTWQGHLRLSLVTCPVALYTATSKAGDVSFNLINPKTNNRIRMVTTDPETGPVNRGDLVKGYEVSKNSYIVVTDEELKSVRLDSTKTIDIERFVAEGEIDRLYWNDPYYLTPDGGVAGEAYGVIRDALAATGRIALGRVVMHTRERLLALEPRDNGIVAWSLRTKDEVRDAAPYFEGVSSAKTDKNMLAIAEKIIEQGEGDFDPSTFTDRYEEALKALIAAKGKGQAPVAAEPPKDTEVSDLMEALRQSLQRGASSTAARKPAGRAGTATAAPKTTRRKPAASRRKAG